MLQLLGPFTGQLEFFVRSLLGFLDKSVNNDDPIAMKEAIKCAANARVATSPQHKQPVSKSFGVRPAETWAMLGQELNQTGLVSQHVHRHTTGRASRRERRR